MPKVTFVAWINGNDDKDTGHLVMILNDSSICLEYGMGGAVAKNFSESVGKPFALGELKTTSKDLVVTQTSAAANARFQQGKQKLSKPRFTHFESFEVDLTDTELRYIMKMAALRIAVGSYGFLREMQDVDMFATRCLSSLEDLANLRTMRLGVGRAHDLLQLFRRLTELRAQRERERIEQERLARIERERIERETLPQRARNVERGLIATGSARTDDVREEATTLARENPGLRYRGRR